jgi:hypothetical protein
MKTRWKWNEWRASRKKRRAVTNRVSPMPCRRVESSADKRLCAAYGGWRSPDRQRFQRPTGHRKRNPGLAVS